MQARPLRIAIFHDLPPSGAKRALYDFSRILAQRDHHLDLYTLTTAAENFLPLAPFVQETFVEDMSSLDILPPRFPLINQTRNVVRRLRYIQEIDRVHQQVAQQINVKSYDLAFVHNCNHINVPNILQHLTIPSVYFCHEPFRPLYEPRVEVPEIRREPEANFQNHKAGPSWLPKAEGLWYGVTESYYIRACKRNELLNVRTATQLLTNSYYSREVIYRTYGIFPRVNYLGVDPQQFHPMQNVKKEDIVLSVGRVDALKQHHLVVESVGQLPAGIRPGVVILGEAKDTPYVQYVNSLAKQLDVDVQMHSLSSAEEQQELVLWYNRARAVVFVPILEPFGLVSLEAMACGTPIIGVKEGGIREVIVDEVTGLLVERNSQHIAQALARVLQDTALATKFAHFGRKYVCEHWTWEHACDQLEEHFNSVLP